MNLVTEPWIPVVKPDGTHLLASLMEVFTQGSEFADLAVRPHERIALMRLFICIAQAALDGPNNKTWEATPKRLEFDTKKYLIKWQDSFNLFHAEKPFLQIPNLSKVPKSAKSDDAETLDSLTPVSKLNFALATGNNTTLFDHSGLDSTARKFPFANLALMLLTYQQFSPGGLIAKVQWEGKITSKSSGHAPCTPNSMLHTFIREKNLYLTLCKNLLSKEIVEVHFGFKAKDYWGKPIWEIMPQSPEDKAAITNATETYLGRLVPLSRLCRLNIDSNSLMLGNGLTYLSHPKFLSETSATLIVNKDQERQVLGAGAKAIWRELSALIVSRKNNGEAGGALVLENIAANKQFDIWVGALLSNKASILDTVESVFHVPEKMRLDRGRKIYDQEIKWAETIASRLSWAIDIYRQEIDAGWNNRVKKAGAKKGQLLSQLHSKATLHYWTAVEKSRHLLMAHLEYSGSDPAIVKKTLEQWRKAVYRISRESYQLACGQGTPRQIRAFALGWDKLTSKRKSQDSTDTSDAETQDTDNTEE